MDRIEKLNAFLVDNPNDSFLQHALAMEYIKLGEDEMAKNLLENILTKEPAYVGSYYHLAKLLERINKNEEAIKVYETGMAECEKVKDKHAYNELKMAWEELTM